MLSNLSPRQLRATVAAFVILIAGAITVTISLGPDGDHGANITITVNEQQDRPPESASEGIDETEVTVPKAAVSDAKQAEDFGNLHDESPPGVPQSELDAVERHEERIQSEDPLPLTFPQAATPRIIGCKSRFVRNQSSRNGVTPRAFAVHYTAGAGTLDAFVALFDRASFQASAHFIHDRFGGCRYIVPIYRKAWTIAALNSQTVNTEVINTGYQKPFMSKAGYRELGRTFAQVNHAFPQIKLQAGAVRNCIVTRPGVITHYQGGLCSGGHVDICALPCRAPAGPPFSLRPIIRQAKVYRCKLYRKTARSKRICLRKV